MELLFFENMDDEKPVVLFIFIDDEMDWSLKRAGFPSSKRPP